MRPQQPTDELGRLELGLKARAELSAHLGEIGPQALEFACLVGEVGEVALELLEGELERGEALLDVGEAMLERAETLAQLDELFADRFEVLLEPIGALGGLLLRGREPLELVGELLEGARDHAGPRHGRERRGFPFVVRGGAHVAGMLPSRGRAGSTTSRGECPNPGGGRETRASRLSQRYARGEAVGSAPLAPAPGASWRSACREEDESFDTGLRGIHAMSTMGGAGLSSAEPRTGLAESLSPVRMVSGQRELPARVVSARVPLGTRLRELWASRELFAFLVRKDLKVKYKGSVLGLLWSLLNPAVMLIVYDIVFTKFLKNNAQDFALYLFAALIVWMLFQTALMGSSSVLVSNAAIVKKVAFPREILALSQVGTATVFFGFQMIVLVLFLVGLRITPDWTLLPLLPWAIIDLVLFTAALSVFLSAVTVYMRDVEHLIVVLLLAWQWGIPMVYSFNFVNSGDHRWIANLMLADPLAPVVLVFQRVLYGLRGTVGANGVVTPFGTNYPIGFYVEMLAWVLVGSIALLVLALFIFGRIEGNFAEEL